MCVNPAPLRWYVALQCGAGAFVSHFIGGGSDRGTAAVYALGILVTAWWRWGAV